MNESALQMGDILGLGGKVAIVTGAAQGIGLEYARGLGQLGVKVVLADIADAQPAATELTEQGIEAMSMRTDVTNEQSLSETVSQTIEKFGGIDILVNNAAIYGTMQKKSWAELNFDDWDVMLRVNVTGTFLAAKAVLPAMCDQKNGSIINISSGVVFNSPPNMAHYTASKSAVIGLTRSIAREVGPYNVRVNSVSPGLTMSEATQKLNKEGYADKALERRCLKRHEEPRDLVGTIIYLSSSLAEFVTGQNLIVDGGVAFS